MSLSSQVVLYIDFTRKKAFRFLPLFGPFGRARIGRSSDGDRGEVLRAHARRATKGRKGQLRTGAPRRARAGGGLDNGSGSARGARVSVVRSFELRVVQLEWYYQRVGRAAAISEESISNSERAKALPCASVQATGRAVNGVRVARV